MNDLAAASAFNHSLHASAFSNDLSIEQIIRETIRAGFNAVELTFSSTGPLSFTTTQSDCAALQSIVKAAGLTISALSIEDDIDVQLAAPQLELRQAAIQQIRNAIERAAWLGTDLVNIRPAIIRPQSLEMSRLSYEETYTFALQALAALRFEAMQHAVRLACRAGGNGFLLSPMEIRSFIDTINSPWIGVCLDVDAVAQWVHPLDWIQSLSHRIMCVHAHCNESEMLSDKNRISDGELVSALKEVRYNGFITCLNRPKM